MWVAEKGDGYYLYAEYSRFVNYSGIGCFC